ncbi:hypothetical protein D3C72_2534470 [compost metagenome]
MTIQVTVPARPLMAVRIMNRVSAAMKLVSSDSRAKQRVTLSAFSGTPRLLTFPRLRGAMPVLDMAQRMRVEA